MHFYQNYTQNNLLTQSTNILTPDNIVTPCVYNCNGPVLSNFFPVNFRDMIKFKTKIAYTVGGYFRSLQTNFLLQYAHEPPQDGSTARLSATECS